MLQLHRLARQSQVMRHCSPNSASNVILILNNLQESSNQEQTLGRKCKNVLGAQHIGSYRPSAATGQSEPKRMRFTEEHGLSDSLPHATATDSAEGKQDTQNAKQAAAAATLTATPELGELAPPDHDAEMLPAGNKSQQKRLHKPPVQTAYTNRRGVLAAVFGPKTPADRVEVRGPPQLPLAQKLNPNNAAFDPVFAAEYRAKRAQDLHYLDSKVRKQQSKLLKRVHWVQKSAFTAEEHGYLLDLQGECHVCCAVLCCAVLCCAVLCCAVLCCAVLCCAVLCCAALRCAVLRCAVLCCAVLRCALRCAVLCCAALCCAVLPCAVQCCAALCCAGPGCKLECCKCRSYPARQG